MLVSIIVKALNEERHIAKAIESALLALAGRSGEVILADSGSSDRTVDVARRYPIRIVQLADVSERSCGAGPQLGFQASHGDYVCLIDGDMVLDPGFLDDALDFLEANPSYAGVSGRLRDVNLDSLEYVRRGRRSSPELASGDTDRLNGGGLFRRAAIAHVGYFTDRNLHSYEEFDLGARLTSAGWRLHRLTRPFVEHYGHTTEAYALLWRRLTSKYAFGIGELVRSALLKPQLGLVLSHVNELKLWALVIASWGAAGLAATLLGPLAALLTLFLAVAAPVALMSYRYRSLALGAYAVAGWQVHSLGLILGFLRPRRDPAAPIAARVLHDDTSRIPAEPSQAAQARGASQSYRPI